MTPLKMTLLNTVCVSTRHPEVARRGGPAPPRRLRCTATGPAAVVLALSGALAGYSTPASAAPAASTASCEASQKEFALLASMGMRDEAASAWKALPASCRKALGKTGKPPAANAAAGAILHYGAQLHAQYKNQHLRQLQQPLATIEVPEVNQSALAGLGPDNMARAIGGMVLDLAATGLSSHQQHDLSKAAAQLGDAVRGDEQRWWDNPQSSGVGHGAPGQGGADGAPVSRIPLPAGMSSASCRGTFAFLAPAMHDFPDATLRQARTDLLAQSIPDTFQQIRGQVPNKNQAMQALKTQLASIEATVARAKAQADESDGRGDQVSTREVENNKIGFALQCTPGVATIHMGGVCDYILWRWQSLIYRAMIDLYPRC